MMLGIWICPKITSQKNGCTKQNQGFLMKLSRVALVMGQLIPEASEEKFTSTAEQ